MLMSPPPTGSLTPPQSTVASENRVAFSPTQSSPGLQQSYSPTSQLTPGMANLGGSGAQSLFTQNNPINQIAKALGFRR